MYKEVHVIPLNDGMEHIERVSCNCHPVVEKVDDGIIVSHNALDCREVIEEAEEIINE